MNKQLLLFAAFLTFSVGAQAQMYVKDATVTVVTSANTLGEVNTNGNPELFIAGNLTLEGTTTEFENDGAEVHIGGDVIRNSNDAAYKSSGDDVFVGSAEQTIEFGEPVNKNAYMNNFIISKPAGSYITVKDENVVVDGTIKFNNGGILKLDKGLTYTGTSGQIFEGYGSAGDVDKFVMIPSTNTSDFITINSVNGTTYELPIGASDDATATMGEGMQLMSVTPTVGGGQMTVGFVQNDNSGVTTPIDVCPGGNKVTSIAENGYWTIETTSVSAVDVTLTPADFTAGTDYTVLLDDAPTGIDPCDAMATALPIQHQGIALTSGTNRLSVGVASSPLPAEILSFDGRKEELNNIITWTTGNENNVSHFTVERSFSGFEFENVGEVTAQGQSLVKDDYNFVDAGMKTSAYYRLTIVDNDGATAKTSVVYLERGQDELSDLDIYPVPASTELNVQSDIVFETMEVRNLSGQLVISKTANGDYNESIDVSNLAPGVYFISCMSGGNVQSLRFVKQ